MGAEDADPEPSSTPKLSYFSLPIQSPEPPGMSTPPFRSSASIPFHWEEAPGKPRSRPSTNSATARCLELPPRLQSGGEGKIESPTTVFEGPYVSRSSSYSVSFGRERRVKSFAPSPDEKGRVVAKDRRGSFSFWVTRSLKGNTRVSEDTCASISPSSTCSVSSWSSAAAAGGGDDKKSTKVKITRFRRTGSLRVFSRSGGTRSHLWASIKQVVTVPWRSRKVKKENGPSC